MGENIYFITINNIKHKFELNDSSLQFCPDEKDEEEWVDMATLTALPR